MWHQVHFIIYKKRSDATRVPNKKAYLFYIFEFESYKTPRVTGNVSSKS
jgi:hypothetical protein